MINTDHTHTAGGIGDDVYSVGYDGGRFWVGGKAIPTKLTFAPKRKLTRQEEHVTSPSPGRSPSPSSPASFEEDDADTVSVGDVIGCCLDLERGVASFLKNGVEVSGHIEFHHCCSRITPALSFSAGVRLVGVAWRPFCAIAVSHSHACMYRLVDMYYTCTSLHACVLN